MTFVFMQTEKRLPLPQWDMENATEKLHILENDWNTLDPEKVIANYSEDAEVRFGTEFLNNREEIRQFLIRKWQQQLGFKLKLDLWGALKGRMAVRFECEWKDAARQWYRSYGIQVFQFDDNGYIQMNFASFNDEAIAETDCKLKSTNSENINPTL
jgi:nuclear transport factor 2 (NTF2) superfamily protein